MIRRAGRTGSIVLAIVGATFALLAASATAHKRSFQTDLVAYATGLTPPPYYDEYFVDGNLTSPRQGCLPERTVKLFGMENAGTPSDKSDDVRTLVTTDSTDINGAFYLQGKLPDGNDYVTVRAARKNIGPSGHRHICKTGSLTITD